MSKLAKNIAEQQALHFGQVHCVVPALGANDDDGARAHFRDKPYRNFPGERDVYFAKVKRYPPDQRFQQRFAREKIPTKNSPPAKWRALHVTCMLEYAANFRFKFIAMLCVVREQFFSPEHRV